MPKFRCTRDVIRAEGDQEFEVTADDIEEAREMFRAGKAELVESNVEVTALADFDLDCIWED